jgi:PPP family 3-phenylpropionic acid transporter
VSGFIPRLAAVYAGLFIAMGVQLPFMPVWFAAKGLDSPAIGTLVAFATVARLLIVPLGTHAADRAGQLKPAIIVAACAALCGFVCLAFAKDRMILILLYALASAAAATLLPLLETYAVKGLELRGRSYGPIRLWGSIAFIAGNLAAGILAPLVMPAQIVWLVVAAFLVCTLLTPGLIPVSLPRGGEARGGRVADGYAPVVVILAVAAASLIQASHAFYYAFSTLEWTAAGFSSLSIGTLWALGVAVEVMLFAASARFPLWLTPIALLLVGGLGATVRWAGMALDPHGLLLLPLQGLHAFSFGATHLGAVLLVARAAPSGFAASAQGVLATSIGLSMAGAMVASGNLRPVYGGATYAVMAVLALAGAGCALLALQRAARPKTLR